MWTLVFVAITLVLVFISRESLMRPRSHGFYRFFAWETILALILLNIPVWFHDPLHWHQVASWILLTVSIVPLLLGIIGLQTRGSPRQQGRDEPELLAFERTTVLVQSGIFSRIRHPLYASLLLLAWGLFFKEPTIAGAGLIAAATILLVLMAKRDEAECLQRFGHDYEEYMRQTRMFIPFLF